MKKNKKLNPNFRTRDESRQGQWQVLGVSLGICMSRVGGIGRQAPKKSARPLGHQGVLDEYEN